MTRKNFRTLSDPIMADPVRRAHIEEIGRAMKLVIALAKLCDAQCDAAQDESVEGDASKTVTPNIKEEDSLFLSTLKEGIEELGGRLEVTAVFPDRHVDLLPPGPSGQSSREE
jgi:hypothetical protein